MRRLLTMAALVLAVVATPAVAQDDAGETPQVAQMRQQIEARFGAQVQSALGLTDQQAAQLKATLNVYGPRRRQMEREERAIKLGLQGQLRPGVAADADSVAKLTDRLLALKVAYVQTFVDEDKEMARYLTSVQRAQFQVMRERLMARIEEIRRQRQGMGLRGGAPSP
jgi:hypothetical protein